jgi:hypothetical protein
VYRYPVRVRADRTEPPGRWLWLVKWLLLVPHYVVLSVLWAAFAVLTLVAYLWVLVTGRYPAAIFDFNVGVLRWSWRVSYYGYQVLGTDRYPPFTLAEVSDYPAGLEADPPLPMPRWRPLVAWLLALPHLLLLAAFAGGTWSAARGDDVVVAVPAGLVSVAVLIAAFALLFTGRYPAGLYDLLVGIGRWAVRVVAYVALLAGAYPPFRLDQGAREPDGGGPVGPAGDARPHASSGRQSGRIVAVVAGVLMLFGGLGAAALGAGAVTLSAQRQQGYLESPTVSVVTPTAAITGEGIDLHADARALEITGLGDVRITVTGAGTYFLGIARQDDVDRWLAGRAHDELVNPYAENGPVLRRSPGAVVAVTAPADQPFWLASASGAQTVRLDWTATGGHFAVVLSNVDGQPGVAADVRAAARLPDLTPVGAGLLAAGLLVLLSGIGLVFYGASGLGGSGPPPPPPNGPTPPPTVPVRTPVTTAPQK